MSCSIALRLENYVLEAVSLAFAVLFKFFFRQPRCFSSYMSMQCSSIFPRCTAPQSRDEAMPAGGKDMRHQQHTMLTAQSLTAHDAAGKAIVAPSGRNHSESRES